ncbi:MAG: stalk domain-containing protein [Defluviitaleaceae bacterium]|nr:stalk domain-containing protein [Defluviitaleaceae bacterium]
MKLAVTIIAATFLLYVSAYAQEIPVYVNGQGVDFAGAHPVNLEGRVFVPVRDVFEAMGFEVGWDDGTATASVSNTAHTVSIRRGDDFITVNGDVVYPDVPPQIIDGSLMLPLRAIAQAVGANVEWTEDSRVVITHRRPTLPRLHGWHRRTEPHNYEDLLPITLDDVDVQVLDFIGGIYHITLSEDMVSFDPRGALNFFWNSDDGSFSDAVDTIPNYASFVFSARYDTDNQNVTMVVGVSDGLGQSHRRAVILKGNDRPNPARNTEQSILAGLNNVRADNGLAPLIWHEELAEVMREQNEFLARGVMGNRWIPDDAWGTVAHMQNAGIEFSVHNRFSATSRGNNAVAIVRDFTNVNRIHDILNPELTHVGIAVFYYAPTQVFSRQVLIGL